MRLKELKVFTCINHDTVWVGGASIVVARDVRHGQELLDEELKANGLKTYAERPYTLKRVSLIKPGATVLQNGDY